jgi:hypothetical protein
MHRQTLCTGCNDFDKLNPARIILVLLLSFLVGITDRVRLLRHGRNASDLSQLAVECCLVVERNDQAIKKIAYRTALLRVCHRSFPGVDVVGFNGPDAQSASGRVALNDEIQNDR